MKQIRTLLKSNSVATKNEIAYVSVYLYTWVPLAPSSTMTLVFPIYEQPKDRIKSLSHAVIITSQCFSSHDPASFFLFALTNIFHQTAGGSLIAHSIPAACLPNKQRLKFFRFVGIWLSASLSPDQPVSGTRSAAVWYGPLCASSSNNEWALKQKIMAELYY